MRETGCGYHVCHISTTESVDLIRKAKACLLYTSAPGGIRLYLDEIQDFNKKQQQSLLEFMENGSLTLIASTTENPFFYAVSYTHLDVYKRQVLHLLHGEAPLPPELLQQLVQRVAVFPHGRLLELAVADQDGRCRCV